MRGSGATHLCGAAAIAARAHLAFFIRLLASWDEAGVHGVGEELTGVRRIRAENGRGDGKVRDGALSGWSVVTRRSGLGRRRVA